MIVVLMIVIMTAGRSRVLSDTRRYLLPALFFLIGILYCAPFLHPPADPVHIYNQIPKPQTATISGTLEEAPAFDGDKTRLLMKTWNLRFKNNRRSCAGLVRLSLKGPPPEDLSPGDHFMARARLSRVRSFGTPGAFDYKSYLAYQSIWVTGWVRNPALIIKLHTLSPPSLYKKIRYQPERFRYQLMLFLDRVLDNPARGLYKAILTGDKSGVSPETIENFKAAGCLHLLAISGMHMGLVMFFFTGLIAWLLKRSTWIILHVPVKKAAFLLSMIPLLFYALIAGLHTPVVRALFMAAVLTAAVLLDRRKSIPASIAVAALLILVWNPTALYTVSFQLSFAAVIAIAAVMPMLENILNQRDGQAAGRPGRTKRWLIAGLSVSLAAMLGTAPLVIHYFNRLSILGPLSTLIVEPFLCLWALITGLAASIMIPFSPQTAALLFKTGASGLHAAVHITRWLAAAPFSSIWLSTPSPLEIFAFYCLLTGLIIRKRTRIALPVIILALLIVIGTPIAIKIDRLLSDESIVNFLDVGQGAAAVLELPGGHTFLIDGGGPWSRRFNVGETVIAPYLWKKRITALDAVIISHPDADHYNGLFFILKRFRPESLWINGRKSGEPAYRNLLALARRLGIEIKTPNLGTVLFKDDGACLRSVAALHKLPPGGRGDKSAGAAQNNRSLVLRLDSGPYSFLFPGDIERSAEERMVSLERDIDVDILLSPHHGSASSNDEKFLRAVSPRYVIFSAGPFKTGRFPAPEVTKRYRRAGVRTFNTSDSGTVSFITSRGGLRIKSFYNLNP